MKMVDQDEEHLRLLAILYYVWGGLTAVFSCLGIFYVIFGGVIAAIAAHEPNGPPVAVGVVFAVIGILMVVVIGTIAALTIWTGRNLQQRKRYTLCIVMACISCLSVPFGTALGVFTLIVLMRPSVKQVFGQPSAPA